MRTKTLIVVGVLSSCGAGVLLGACATDASVLPSNLREDEVPLPSQDSGADAEGEDAGDEERPCSDCAYYPDVCSADVFCPAATFDPQSTGALDPRTRIHTIRSRTPTDVWVAGGLGALAHFDGSSWKRVDIGAEATINALWLRDDGEVAMGRLTKFYSHGVDIVDAGVSSDGWTSFSSQSGPDDYFSSLKALHQVWAPRGAEWLWAATTADTNDFNTSGLWRVRVTDEATFELGIGIAHTACADIVCRHMTALHGISADDLWAVGDDGKTLRISGAQGDAPAVQAFNSQTWEALHGVWAASPTEAWSVGARGTIRHYTGDPLFWDVVSAVPTTRTLNAVWGSSPSDVWAVGDGAVVLHYDGTSWSRVKIAGLGPHRPDLYTVWVAAPGRVWIGGDGVVLTLGGLQ